MVIPDRVRYFNKRFTNPLLGRLVGRSWSPFAMVHHVGRISGKTYQTPVIAMRKGDRFVFALTYGIQVDWYKNIKAAGGCQLSYRGQTYSLVEPETLSPEEARSSFSQPFRFILKINGLQDYFRMKIRETDHEGGSHG